MMTDKETNVVPITFTSNDHEERNKQIRKAHLRVKKLKEDKTREVSDHDDEISNAEAAVDEAMAAPMPTNNDGHIAWRKSVKTEWTRWKAEGAARAKTMANYNAKIKEANKTEDTLIVNVEQTDMLAAIAAKKAPAKKATVKRRPKMEACPKCGTNDNVDEAGVDDQDKGSLFCAACGDFFSVAAKKQL